MNFALETKLLGATEYFNNQMRQVYVRRNCKIYPFEDYAYSPDGGRCYYLSCWSIMGLAPDSWLCRGQINLPERPGWKASDNYKHGWVEFTYDHEDYIYDSLNSSVWPKSYWDDTYGPHDITFQKTQQEILNLSLNSDNAFQINDYLWQFKKSRDMLLEFDSVNDGFLKDALSCSQIYCYSTRTSYFLAEDRG